MDCRSVSAAERVCDCDEGVQCPNERKPIFFMQAAYRDPAWFATVESALGRGRARAGIDLYRSGHAGYQPNTIRYLIDVNAYRYALRETHPGEDRIDRGESGLVRLRIRDVDAAGNAADMAANQLLVAHQFDGCRIAL